jgi:hypothetical protein
VPLRLAAPLALLTLAAVLLAGCGDSSTETGSSRTETMTQVAPNRAPVGASAKSCDAYSTDAEFLRATGIPCDQARQVMSGWRHERSCSLPRGASRNSCLTRSYRCLGTRTDRGVAVSCSRQGQSIAFTARQRG